ncbi:ATP-binding protein [Arthrobacter sp. AK04]|nr:ATP-binding protein [Arthrobacter sp. AK04]
MQDVPEFASWLPAWQAIQQATHLGDDDFIAFVRDFELNLGISLGDKRAQFSAGTLLEEQALADLDTLAWTFQQLVADAARPVQVEREELLVRLGWQNRLTFRHRHKFPVPGTYITNETAQTAIDDAFSRLSGGYLALIGPAGSGKSTLLSDISIPGRVVRYYAYVPDSPDPLSGRGEAESFLSDLSLALHDAGLPRRSQPVGLPNLRKTLQEQLALAAQLWLERREKTVIIIDGLDHVPREQNPTRSMLDELPAPGSIEAGVFVLLGSQTTGILPQQITAALETDERVVSLPPLSQGEIRSLAEQAELTSWMWPGQIDKLIEVSEGHPLALTYLLEELVRLPEAKFDIDQRRLAAGRVLTNASEYGGDVEQRYVGYFKAISDNSELVELLGLVARLRTSLNINWLKSWAPQPTVSQFLEATRIFFRSEDEEWQFIHNSFRLFLINESAKIGGHYSMQRDRSIHANLAELCADSGMEWPVYADEEIAQRFLAEQYDAVLEVATPAKLRGKLIDLHALSTVSDHTGIALKAAAESNNSSAFVSLALFAGELAVRNQVAEPEKLVDSLAAALHPTEALGHIVRAGKLVVPAPSAMKQAARWASEGHIRAAATVLNASNGLEALDERDFATRQSDAVADWAEATLAVSGLDAVLTQLDRHRTLLPTPRTTSSEDPQQPSPVERQGLDRVRQAAKKTKNDRARAMARCTDRLVDVRDNLRLDRLMKVIDREAPLDWRARARLVRAMSAMEDGVSSEVIRWIREMLELEAKEENESTEPLARADAKSGQAEAEGNANSQGHSVGHTDSTHGADETMAALSDGDQTLLSDAPKPRIALNLRLKAGLTLVQAGLYDVPELNRLIDPDETAGTARDFYGEGLEPYRDALNLSILNNFRDIAHLHKRAQNRSSTEINLGKDKPHRTEGQATSLSARGDLLTDPAGPAAHPPASDPGRVRFRAALRALGIAHAEHLAYRTGFRDRSPVLALCADQILRILEVSREESRAWTGWYQVRAAMPEVLGNLVALYARSGGSAELLRLARQLDSAWTGRRAQYWSVDLQQVVLKAFAEADDAAEEWIRAWLNTLDGIIDTSGLDPAGRVEAWLQQATLRAHIGQRHESLNAVRSAVASAASLGYRDDSEQLAHWIDWLVAAKNFGSMNSEQFINAGTVFASRLTAAARQDESAATAAGERLIDALWPVSPRAAAQVGRALCEAGVLAETDLIQAVILAACQDQSVNPKLLSVVATKLLLPIAKYPSNSLRPLLEERGDPDALVSLDLGFQTWTVDGAYASSLTSPRKSPQHLAEVPLDSSVDPETAGVVGAGRETSDSPSEWPSPLPTPAGLLSQLRTVSTPLSLSANWWTEAAGGALATPRIPGPVAAAILEQAVRLDPPVHVFGKIVSIVATSGHLEAAMEGLQASLSRLPSASWSPYYDGGKRLKLFESVLASDVPELRILALRDLAEAISSDSRQLPMSGDLKQVLETVAGSVAVAGAWPIVEAYLDVFAPPSADLDIPQNEPTSDLPDNGTTSLVTLIADFLDHPTKAPQEAARRILAESVSYAEGAIFNLLADAVYRGGWAAEAALQVLVYGEVRNIPQELAAAVDSAAVGNDAICRDLAGRVCELVGRPRPKPEPHALPAIYSMQFPELPEQRIPEIDKDGTPFVDTNDPQQVIAPFDHVLRILAQRLGLDPIPLIYRASYLALSSHGNQWTDGGHKEMAERLNRRGQRHIYRPWAYLVGRRAVSQVLTELIDAQEFGLPADVATRIGLIAPHLLAIEPEPLTAGIPSVWRPAGTADYDTRAWCNEAADAAESYKDLLDTDGIYVLAEASEWHSLEWGHPVEERRVFATHRRGSNPLLTDSHGCSWAYAYSSRRYPHIATQWAHMELVVEGQEQFTDAPFLDWWAFHPAAAADMHWTPDPQNLFGWIGEDGHWRARTEYRVRGLLSHSAPARTYCASVWRVVLSPLGRAEIGRAFPGLSRSLVVTRILQENRREGRQAARSEVVTALAEPEVTNDAVTL